MENKAYQTMQGLSRYMDRYYLDALIGVIPGWGDAIALIWSRPILREKAKERPEAHHSRLFLLHPLYLIYILFGFFLLQAVDLVGISILYHCQEHVVLIVVIVVFDKNVAHIASRYLA